MTMKEIGYTKDFCPLEHGAAEKSKPFGVVGKISRSGSVEAIAIEKRRVINEKELYAGISGAGSDGTETVLVVEGHGDALHDGAFLRNSGQAITWHIHANLVSCGG